MIRSSYLWGNQMTKVTAAQLRVLKLIGPPDGTAFPGRHLSKAKRSERPMGTIRALERKGLIDFGVSREGGGIGHGHYFLTAAGLEALSHV